MSLARIVADLAGEASTNPSMFRPGQITAIVRAGGGGVPQLVEIQGRQMPVVGASLTVGDLVIWADSPDPWCVGQIAGT